MTSKLFSSIAVLALLAACASNPQQLPYPAFISPNDLPDSFLAGLPGSRAKILSSDTHTRRSSMLLQLPADWSFSTGAAPDKTLEIYLLEGDLTLGGFELKAGGYAYLPSGSMGVSMSSRSGAAMLYFLDDVYPDAVIQTPIINDSNLLQWQVTSTRVEDFGIAIKELRADPGSGARTWLMRIDPAAVQGWRYASAVQEGYLVSGEYRHSECVAGEVVSGTYTTGGYFLRPAGAVNGGAEAVALQSSIWLLRVPEHVTYTSVRHCVAGGSK